MSDEKLYCIYDRSDSDLGVVSGANSVGSQMTTDHEPESQDRAVRFLQGLPQEYPLTTDHDLLALIEKRGYESLRAALSAVVELIKPYLEHDIKNVTKVNGVYDKEQAEAWEKVHGHDIRLNCYPEFGCQLLIDPEDLFLTIKKELQ